MANWTMVFYSTPSGHCPVQDYIDQLPAVEANAVYRMLTALATQGTSLTFPQVRQLKGTNLWELRVRTRGNAHRVFYVALSGNGMLLLHAFAKKSDKTPQREIETAEQRLRGYWPS